MKFRVPVFRTESSDPAVKGATHEGKSLEAYLRDTGLGRRARVESEGCANVHVCDAQGFQKGLCVVPGLIGLALLAVAVLVPANALPGLIKDLFRQAEGWENVFRLFPLLFVAGIIAMAAVFGLIGLLFLLIGVSGLIFRRTWIEEGLIRQRARLFGVPWARCYPASSATGVSCRATTRSGSRTWFDVVIERDTAVRYNKAGRRFLLSRVTVASNVPSMREAEDLAARLRRDLHLPEGAEGSGAEK